MTRVPRLLIGDRVHSGHRDAFPVSPQGAYDSLTQRVPPHWWRDEWQTDELGSELPAAVEALLATADGPAGALAVQRAGLTLGWELMNCCDDGSGFFGQSQTDALTTYAALDRTACPIPADAYWRDLLEITAALAAYGLVPPDVESRVLRAAGAHHQLPLVTALAAELSAEYRAARMPSQAKTLFRLGTATVLEP